MNQLMNQQSQMQAAPQPATSNKPEAIGLENIDLRQVPKIDLRQLEPGQGGYIFEWLGAIKFEGQYGPYYLIGVKDQNGNMFKFYSNGQIFKMIEAREKPFDQIGSRFFIECKFKPGMKYQTKSGEREVRGYIYEIKPLEQ